MHVCLVSVWQQKPEEGVGSIEAGVVGGYKLPNLGVGNQALVFWKSRKISQPLRHISSGRNSSFKKYFIVIYRIYILIKIVCIQGTQMDDWMYLCTSITTMQLIFIATL